MCVCVCFYFRLSVNTLARYVQCLLQAVKAFSWQEKSLCESQFAASAGQLLQGPPDAVAFTSSLSTPLSLLIFSLSTLHSPLFSFLFDYHFCLFVCIFCLLFFSFSLSLAAAHSTSCFAFAFLLLLPRCIFPSPSPSPSLPPSLSPSLLKLNIVRRVAYFTLWCYEFFNCIFFGAATKISNSLLA